MDKHTVKVVKGNETVGHLSCKFSQIAWYFIAHFVEKSVLKWSVADDIVSMEIPYQLEFNCSNIVQMKHLKELLASKILV